MFSHVRLIPAPKATTFHTFAPLMRTFTQSTFHFFEEDISGIPLPERFTFPFQYHPHPLSVLAAGQLQHYLQTQRDWVHDFGDPDAVPGTAIGKMFGVLVVQDAQGQTGFLAAFSGKLADSNHHGGFVPPVFDILEENGFFKIGEAKQNAVNREIERLEQSPEFTNALHLLETARTSAAQEIAAEKIRAGEAKAQRDAQRNSAGFTAELEAQLVNASKHDHFILKDLKKRWNNTLTTLEHNFSEMAERIAALKKERKKRSAELQQAIFDQFAFLNALGQHKSLGDIFQANAAAPPPAGAGECAAPKLLQYAFLHGYRPLAMAEFWWGTSPVGEVRRHKMYYPACRGKCEPILGHMLQGLPLETPENWQASTEHLDLPVLFEDDHLVVVNKPPMLLSVPGKTVTDSVYFRMRQRYSDATGPMIVHRLDMSTSGLLVVAKTEETYKQLQVQFLKRSVQKRYTALLEGTLDRKEGVIDLPLRVDLDDRPHQMVCYEYGKAARTIWETVAVKNGRTLVHFYPVTGRTHQLRVHAAHPLGLNAPIVGDELYGKPGERLFLHAAELRFTHPGTGVEMHFVAEAEFLF